jgi:hypothetical protein
VPITDRAEEFLRARTLGFHAPRPGTRPSPREYERREFTAAEIGRTLELLGLGDREVCRFERCVSRRRVALVRFTDHAPVLLKWPDEDVELDNDYEFVMLDLIGRLSLPERARSAVPAVIGGGPETRIIALEAVDDCISLTDLMKRSAVVDPAHLVALAAALADLHRVDISDAYPRYPEWLLMLPVPTSTRLTVDEYALGCGIDFEAYLRVMQSLESCFQELHRAWEPRGLVHFDLRDDNILFRAGQTGPPVRIIDWELAGFGDPRYDVGYVVGHLLLQWVRTGQVAGDALIAARRNAAAFLNAYQRLAGLDEEELRLVLRYAGITLVVHASMRLQQLGFLGRVGYTCLLVGGRLLREPDEVRLLPPRQVADPDGGRPAGVVA